jgi:hypothetical protein
VSHEDWSGGIGLFLIHPPQEYLKKSTHGSMLRSIEVMSSAGSGFEGAAAGCCARAEESNDASTRAITQMRGKAIERILFRLPTEDTAGKVMVSKSKHWNRRV